MEFKNVRAQVERLLRQYPRLRSSDDLLYGAIVNEAGAGFKTCNEFFKTREALGVPSFETVRRTRQKAQEENEELRPPEEIRQMRMELESQFRNMARGK